MKKSIIYVFAVVIPGLIVGISNFKVFPDSSLPATLMLIVTAGIAGVLTYFSGDATVKVRRYCILADIAICAILCVNLGGHWILAREVSAARQGVEERHIEEDREENRKTSDAERQLALKKAEADADAAKTRLANAERRRLAQLPIEERRNAIPQATPAPQAVMTMKPFSLQPVEPAAKVSTITPRLTPEEVRASWWWFLTGLAIAECAASVLAVVVLSGLWEWDRNHDGIPDHVQTGINVGK